MNDTNAINYFKNLHDESSWRSLLNITKNNGWYLFQVTGDVSNITSAVMIIVGKEIEMKLKVLFIIKNNCLKKHI
jgi:hypothetical protein